MYKGGWLDCSGRPELSAAFRSVVRNGVVHEFFDVDFGHYPLIFFRSNSTMQTNTSIHYMYQIEKTANLQIGHFQYMKLHAVDTFVHHILAECTHFAERALLAI